MSMKAVQRKADLVGLKDANYIIARNRGKSLFIVNIRYLQVTVMFFGLQHCNTVPKEADKPPPRKHHGHAYAPLQLQGLLFQAPRSPY